MTKTGGMGFGDYIRGSIAAKQICDEHDIEFCMDLRLHPISFYLQNRCEYKIPDVKAVHDIQDMPNFTGRALLRYLKSKTSLKSLRHNNLHVYSNVWPASRHSKRVANAIKHHLTPTAECEDAIAAALGSLTDYRAIHIRAGDLLAFKTKIVDSVRSIDYAFEEIIDRLGGIKDVIESSNQPCIVLSDSTELKKFISKKYSLYATSTKSKHLALNTNKSALLDTLVDFFTLSRAKHIDQFSVHSWGSGFSDAAHWLYGVPIQKHKLSPTN